jgi:hypothetical protein
MFSYKILSKKPILFKSFIGLSVKQFDDIYDEIKSKYTKHKIKRLSYRKDRKRSIGGGRHFKLDVKDRIIMVLVLLYGIRDFNNSGFGWTSSKRCYYFTSIVAR